MSIHMKHRFGLEAIEPFGEGARVILRGYDGTVTERQDSVTDATITFVTSRERAAEIFKRGWLDCEVTINY